MIGGHIEDLVLFFVVHAMVGGTQLRGWHGQKGNVLQVLVAPASSLASLESIGTAQESHVVRLLFAATQFGADKGACCIALRGWPMFNISSGGQRNLNLLSI